MDLSTEAARRVESSWGRRTESSWGRRAESFSDSHGEGGLAGILSVGASSSSGSRD